MPLFHEPRTVRAKRTELLLGLILGAMLLGLAVLAKRWHIGPRSGQTVLSQIMAMAVGRGWAYYVISITITVVLALAANTSFGGLPVLASLLARDNYLPHLFTLRGDRQVFGNGIWVLTVLVRGAAHRRGRQHQRPDPAVRHRGVHRLHAVAERGSSCTGGASGRPAGAAGRPSTASAPSSRRSPPSSSSSPSSPRAPGSSSWPSRPSSCSSSASTPTTSAPPRSSASTRHRAARAEAHHRGRAGQPGLPAHRARPVARPSHSARRSWP